MATPDPRWLELLKASGWQTVAIAVAVGVFLLAAHWGWLPPLEPTPFPTSFFDFISIGYDKDGAEFIYPLQINNLVSVVERILKLF